MKIFFLIFLALLYISFFGATDINNTFLLTLLMPFVFLEFSKKNIYSVYFKMLLVGLFLNIISCYYFRDQSMFLTLRISSLFLYVFFYYLLKTLNLSIQEMEKALFALVVIFCLSYIFQYVFYPVAIFSGGKVEYGEEVRIRLVGQGFSSLGYFYGLNKFLKNQKCIFHIFLSILCFCVIFLMGFRTMLVLIVLFTFVMIFQLKGFNWKLFMYMIFCSGILFLALQVPVFSNISENMLNRQETEVFSNKDYIRVVQFNYFTQKHFKNIFEYILGSGLPALPSFGGEFSKYGIYMQKLDSKGINYVDFGLLSLSWMIGIFTVVAMIGYSVKAVILRVNSEYCYLGIWFIYLILVSFTTAEFFRPGNFIIQAIALYIVEKAYLMNLFVKAKRKITYYKRGMDINHITEQDAAQFAENYTPRG